MGVSSTHLAFENMIASGIPTGGRRNVAEDRMTDRRLKATAQHRCIRSHRLGHVSAADQAILQAVYCGADWTRSLDETIGKGPRAQLHRSFTHEVLQVLPLTPAARSAWEKVCKLPPSEGGIVLAANPRLTAYKGVLAALGCPSPFETCMPEDVREGRARLTHLARWLRTDRKPEWSGDPSQVMAQLRVVLGQRKPDHAATLLKAREAVSEALHGPEKGVHVVLKKEVGKRPPATVQIYLASLARGGSKAAKEQMARIAIEAGKMLKGAQKAAGLVTTPHHHHPEKAEKPRARRDLRSMADAL